MSTTSYPRVASLKTAAAFRGHLTRSNIPLQFDDTVDPAGPLAQPLEIDGVRVGNRFCILPMEGWDGTRDGEPSDLTRRRWRNFGTSGAKLIWGGEAVAVRHDGRANPNQLMLTPSTKRSIAALRDELVYRSPRTVRDERRCRSLSRVADHAFRAIRPARCVERIGASCRMSPSDSRSAVSRWRAGADRYRARASCGRLHRCRAASPSDCGFHFIDTKACHGYLGHEMLGATTRPGRYGGPLENRMRFLTEIIDGIRSTVPGLAIFVRISSSTWCLIARVPKAWAFPSR